MKLKIKKPVISAAARKTAKGSGQFSKSEIDCGYKTCYTAMDLHEMDPDRLHNLEEHVMANRRNGNSKRKVLRTSEY